LGNIGIQVGHRPIWPFSLDDLRVYEEIFDNPLIFLHFVEQRVRAGQSKDVDLDDELDHLGLYLEHNNYSLFASNMKRNNNLAQLSFGGFRTPIDNYFKALAQDEKPVRPRQKMPTALIEAIDYLACSSESSRSELASFLLDAEGSLRYTLSKFIETALRENKELLRATPLSWYGVGAATFYIWSPSAPRIETEAIQHTRATMVANSENERRLIEFEYEKNGILIYAQMKKVTLSDVDVQEMERIRERSKLLVKHRIKQATETGPIGRNSTCPCGSGKKYKRCHGY